MKLHNFHRPKKYRNNKQIVILLGAGFVTPWSELNSFSIRELFVKDETFTIDGHTLGKLIFDKLGSYYDHPGVNFETFIAVIESVINHVISSTNIGKSVKNNLFIPLVFEIKDIFLKTIM